MDFFSGNKLFGGQNNKPQNSSTTTQNPNQNRQPIAMGQRPMPRPNISNPTSSASPAQSTAPSISQQTVASKTHENMTPTQNSAQNISQNQQKSENIQKSASAPVAPQSTNASQTQTQQTVKEAYVQPKQQNVSVGDAKEAEQLGLINEVKFSDVYVTPDKKCYIWSGRTDCGLKCVSFQDFPEFLEKMESLFDGNRSYLLNYHGRNYRVERTIALEGPQYCARKMPIEVPDLKQLNFPSGVYSHLLSIAGCSGLILLAGATGSGKSTTVSALLKEYLERKGGYAFTIEDPIEMPLDGVYVTKDGELGLCKQTTPPDGLWEEGIKSALRSKPRYIYLGEIRSPDVASEALRAATSGHLVLSTIHANNVSDAINALVKYAASSGISEEMAYELVANGFLGCIHQVLVGAPKRAILTYLFANPDVNAGCQVRGMLRSGKLNMATLIDQQRVKLEKNLPIFSRL